MATKQSNQDFPPHLTDERLEQWTQENIRSAIEGVETDRIKNVVSAMKAQLGMSEIHKRQNDKTNKNTLTVAIAALVLSVLSIGLQFCISKKPTNIENQELKDIKTTLEKLQNSHQSDSVIFYLKMISKGNIKKETLAHQKSTNP